MVRVEHVLESWKTIRRDTVAAVEDFPAGDFNFRATPEMDAFGDIAKHVLASSEGMTGMLLAGEDDFTAPDFRARVRAHVRNADPAPGELAGALRESLERRAAELAAQPPEFFARIITRFDGMKVTKLEMIQQLKEHELTHRSQLFTYLRLKGIVPSTTRRRLANQPAR